jgi:hypothetical protein
MQNTAEQKTIVQVRVTTANALHNLKEYGESYDDVITRLLRSYQKGVMV